MIRRPHRRKENQCVMNRQQSTSISGNTTENGQRTVRPLQVSRVATARATCPPGSRPSSVATSCQARPIAAAVRAPVSAMNSSELSVKVAALVHLPDEAKRMAAFGRRCGWRRCQRRAGCRSPLWH